MPVLLRTFRAVRSLAKSAASQSADVMSATHCDRALASTVTLNPEDDVSVNHALHKEQRHSRSRGCRTLDEDCFMQLLDARSRSRMRINARKGDDDLQQFRDALPIASSDVPTDLSVIAIRVDGAVRLLVASRLLGLQCTYRDIGATDAL